MRGPSTSDTVTLVCTDNATTETGFTIQRSGTSDFAVPTTYQAAANATTWSQTAPRTRTFYYRVRADNLGGGSAWSNVVSLTTP